METLYDAMYVFWTTWFPVGMFDDIMKWIAFGFTMLLLLLVFVCPIVSMFRFDKKGRRKS